MANMGLTISEFQSAPLLVQYYEIVSFAAAIYCADSQTAPYRTVPYRYNMYLNTLGRCSLDPKCFDPCVQLDSTVRCKIRCPGSFGCFGSRE